MEKEEIRLPLLAQINYEKIVECIGSNRKGERWEFSLGMISSRRKEITLPVAIRRKLENSLRIKEASRKIH